MVQTPTMKSTCAANIRSRVTHFHVMALGLPFASHEKRIDWNSLMRRAGVTVIRTSGLSGQ